MAKNTMKHLFVSLWLALVIVLVLAACDVPAPPPALVPTATLAPSSAPVGTPLPKSTIASTPVPIVKLLSQLGKGGSPDFNGKKRLMS
jgi:hypothetical protein